MADNAIRALEPSPSSLMPSVNEWNLMRDMASQLVKTGFLPKAVDTAEKALAIMLKGRELNIPPMQALSNIAIINGKPTVQAELMLALIYRSYGKGVIRVSESTSDHCTVEYRLPGWGDVQTYTFTIKDAAQAGLANSSTYKNYPAAMLRARCISAVARMAFPESIAGMYVPGELGDPVTVTDDGEVVSNVTGEIIEVHAENPMGQRVPLSAYSADEVMSGVDRNGNDIGAMVQQAERSQRRNAPVARAKAHKNDETPELVSRDVQPESRDPGASETSADWKKASARLHRLVGHDPLHGFARSKGLDSWADVPLAAVEAVLDIMYPNGLDKNPDQTKVDHFITRYLPPQDQITDADIDEIAGQPPLVDVEPARDVTRLGQ